MSPFEHGEVFVLADGGEVDLDLGNYERFLDVQLTSRNNLTTGKVYSMVIEKERKGDFLGRTVQVVPHITDAIQDWVMNVAAQPDEDGEVADVCVIELGGTVGDIESMPFFEAMRQFQFRVGAGNMILLHVSLVPVFGEQKTKPTQHTVQELRSLGLTPNFIMCRCTEPLEESTKQKVSQFCHVPVSHVVNVHNVSNIFHVPLVLRDQKLDTMIIELLNLESRLDVPKLEAWRSLAQKIDRDLPTIKIALVGKYTGLTDSYLSVIKSLEHAAWACDCKLEVVWIDSSELVPFSKPYVRVPTGGDFGEAADKEDDSPELRAKKKSFQTAWEKLQSANGILVPGGFGDRGVEGKILALQYAREHKKPALGICLGFQLTVVSVARTLLGHKNANSTEFDKDTDAPVIINMPEISTTNMGGTMRLGSRRVLIDDPTSLAARLYRKLRVKERHRHRYEVNTKYSKDLEQVGLVFTGRDETGTRMEILEIKDHPYFLATQFHPEFQSRPLKPSPPFFGLMLAATNKLQQYLSSVEVDTTTGMPSPRPSKKRRVEIDPVPMQV
eukprot:TRINITY_DN3600_c0_g1_i1.p1 TRINITY_DN3600_c0_g1~~TRINITY_DN3600_c0_g1_i1.p1  ORF type:complete len:609 (+),score=157.23 TRINITY_DN3600_c0_g1_i1:160-1827(+)